MYIRKKESSLPENEKQMYDYKWNLLSKKRISQEIKILRKYSDGSNWKRLEKKVQTYEW